MGWQWFFWNHTTHSLLPVPTEYITIMYTLKIYTFTGGELWQHRSVHEIRNSESLSFLFCIHTPLFSCCRFQTYWQSTEGKPPCRGRKPKGGRAGKPKSHLVLLPGWQNRRQNSDWAILLLFLRILLVLFQRRGCLCGWQSCSPCSSGRDSRGSVPSPHHWQVPVLFAHDGNVCSCNKDEPQVLMARVMVRTPRMLSTNPALA